ncbi:ArsR family transcriptional regulator [Duganella sp. FT135W]|uniref:ArsR family transcriptional regulator n=1 Tax=Duganella flavida TaxID=2692175 RepID=A0A6L8KCD6_9BURK|nr:Rrf2 family transcriptional regulator [Duganella flavida]MYM23898.1 ArsR family transcriptional regulator [Duganella flavida]
MDEQTMAALAGVLDALLQMEIERPDKQCSLARLSKQAQRPMSVLRRQLTMLEEAGLVTLVLEEGGISGTVQLTPPGRELAHQLRA